MSRSRNLIASRGTNGSNPASSSGESRKPDSFPDRSRNQECRESRLAPQPRMPISVVLCWRRQPPRRRSWIGSAVVVDATPFLPGLSPVQGKLVVARFDGGRLFSEGGLLALREIVNQHRTGTPLQRGLRP